MAAGTTPIFPAIPKTFAAKATAANTARDGTGTVVTLLAGGDNVNGARVDRLTVTAQGISHNGMVRVFVTTGSATYLAHEIPVTAETPSGVQRAFTAEWVRTDGNPIMLLGPGDAVTVASHAAESAGLACTAIGGLY